MTILQDTSALTGGWNRYHYPMVITLDVYFGEAIQGAWNAYNGDGDVRFVFVVCGRYLNW